VQRLVTCSPFAVWKDNTRWRGHRQQQQEASKLCNVSNITAKHPDESDLKHH
jgi:hypothetical protein